MNDLIPQTNGEFLPAIFQDQGLRLPSDLTLEQWGEMHGPIFKIARASPWWVGDWLAYGIQRWPEEWTQYVDNEYSPERQADYYKVAREYPHEARRYALSWSCHRTMAQLIPAGKRRDRLLEAWHEQDVPDEYRDQNRSHKAMVKWLRACHIRTVEHEDDKGNGQDKPLQAARVHVERNGDEYEVQSSDGQALATFYTDQAPRWARQFAEWISK